MKSTAAFFRYFFCLSTLGVGWAACAQELPSPALALKNTWLLPEKTSQEPSSSNTSPVFVRADQLSVNQQHITTLTGHAEVRRPDVIIKADALSFDNPTQMAEAKGHVLVNQMGNVFTGPLLRLNLDSYMGYFDDPVYRFTPLGMHGKATRINFLGKEKSLVENATYTSCPCKKPAWVLKARSIMFDKTDDEGVAKDAVLWFKGVPILASPWLSFPLSSKRRSGLLSPTFGFDNVNGLVYGQPFYWNIAPNQDATIMPTIMSARGVNFKNQYRYLLPHSAGEFNVDFMGDDKLRKTRRWRINAYDTVNYTGDWGAANAVVNINRVSDDNYWKDFATSIGWQTQTQRLLSNDLTLSYGRGTFYTWFLAQRWQTLQDSANPIAPPFDRMPQVGMSYGHTFDHQINWSITTDMTHFVADSPLVTTPNAKRATLNTQVSWPFRKSYAFVTPKVALHSVGYDYDWVGSTQKPNDMVTVPTVSLDSGLYFDRHFSVLGKSLTQTLEPRLLYVYTPYVNQSMIPNYDTANQDFSFGSIFSDNTFVGNDKVADANMITAGALSRFWSDESGRELASFAVAQRLRVSPRRVSLNATDSLPPAGLSDILFGSNFYLTPSWNLESIVQYDAKTNLSQRSLVRASYLPRAYHVLNFDYRFQRSNSEQMELSWQWPLAELSPWAVKTPTYEATRRYYGVGSVNYSIKDHRWVNTLIGLEYDAGCWKGRILFQHQQTGLQTSTQSLTFQIEFVGFTSLGLGSHSVLSDNIQNYQALQNNFRGISRYSSYD